MHPDPVVRVPLRVVSASERERRAPPLQLTWCGFAIAVALVSSTLTVLVLLAAGKLS